LTIRSKYGVANGSNDRCRHGDRAGLRKGEASIAKEANQRDIAAGRLTADEYAANFADLHAPLNRHQAVVEADRCYFDVIDEECVGCNLCASVCPVEGCITMVEMTEGVDPRTGRPIDRSDANWTTHPNNPNRVAAE